MVKEETIHLDKKEVKEILCKITEECVNSKFDCKVCSFCICGGCALDNPTSSYSILKKLESEE